MREKGGRKGERGEEWNGMGGVRDGRIWEVEKEKEVVEGESTKNCKAGEQLKNEEGSLGVHCRGGVHALYLLTKNLFRKSVVAAK